MMHNDVLRRIRYALQINDESAISIFKLVDYDMDKEYMRSIMKKEEEAGYLPCRDKILSLFLDGLIIKNRGKQEGVTPVVLTGSQRLSNNEILRKIRIAMSYRDEDMINTLKLANFRLSKGELSALFRKPDHRNFKEAGDQVVRNLLQGMVKKHRPDSKSTSKQETRQQNDKRPPSPSTSSSSASSSESNSVWGKVKPR